MSKPVRLTMKSVNKAIEHTRLELIKGEGYFYFVGHGTENVDASEYVYALNHLCLKEWVARAEDCAERIRAHFAWDAQYQ